MTNLRTMYAGTVEFLDVTVTSSTGQIFSTQQVNISIDGGKTWYPATWQGIASSSRVCSILLGPATTPPLPPAGSWYDVRVQIVDNPEIPIIDAGYLVVQA